MATSPSVREFYPDHGLLGCLVMVLLAFFILAIQLFSP